MAASVQVLGISNAIVDVLSHVDEGFLGRLGAAKSSMVLIDEARAREIYSMIGPATEMSGGSVANSIAGVANLGGSTAYIGCVADDQLGGIFNHDMKSLGVDIRLPPNVHLLTQGERATNTLEAESVVVGPVLTHERELARPARAGREELYR